jgi:hypothetical protein
MSRQTKTVGVLNKARSVVTNARYPGLTLTPDVLDEIDELNGLNGLNGPDERNGLGADAENYLPVDALIVRPHTESHDVEAGHRFATELAADLESDVSIPSRNGSNQSLSRSLSRSVSRSGASTGSRSRRRFCFEMWNIGGKLRYVMGAPDADDLTTSIRSRFPDATTAQFRPPVPSGDRAAVVRPDAHLAGARITLKKDCLYPLRHHATRTDPVRDEDDPHRSIHAAMHSEDAAETTVLQLVFEQVGETWYDRGAIGASAGRIAQTKRDGQSVGFWRPYHSRPDPDRDAASDIETQSGRPAFRTTIRVFAIAADRPQATRRVQAMTGMFSDLDNPATGQRLVAGDGLLRDYALQTEFADALRRSLPPESRTQRLIHGPQNVLTDRELGMLVRFSGAFVGQADSSTIKDAGTVPTDAPDPAGYLEDS